MNFELSATCAVTGKIVETLLERRGPGLVVSVDIGGSLFDLIAANAAEAARCKFVRSHSLLRHQAFVGAMGPQVRVATVLAQPVVFGRIDGWLRVVDGNDPCESYHRRSERIVTRTIDSWSAGRAPIRLLHLGDPDLAIDQLQGASQTIARDRPILTLYTARLEQRKVLALLEFFGYGAFNLSGKSAVTAAPDPLADFGLIAVPIELQEDVSAVAARSISVPDQRPSPWEIDVDRNALPRQRRSAGLFHLLSSASRPLVLERAIPTEDIVCLNDSYPLETAGEHSWRWLGPRPRTRIAVPCPLPCPYTVRLNVIGCKLKNGLADCRVVVEGREVRTDASNSSPGHLSFAASVEPENYAGYMEVDIISAGTLVSTPGDPRTLRMCLESIVVSAWQ